MLFFPVLEGGLSKLQVSEEGELIVPQYKVNNSNKPKNEKKKLNRNIKRRRLENEQKYTNIIGLGSEDEEEIPFEEEKLKKKKI